MPHEVTPAVSASPNPNEASQIAIVVSEYNDSITSKLCKAAIKSLVDNGIQDEDIRLVRVPGAWELVFGAQLMICKKECRGVIVLGAVIKGETTHDRVLADAVAKGLIDVMMTTGKPVSLGVLTVENVAQAQARAGGDQGNKGAEAMLAMIETWRAMMQLAGKRVGVSHTINDMPDKAKGKIGTHSKKIEGKSAGSKR
jgi:6,7-dimethyl-8-ribityllumazine synthase